MSSRALGDPKVKFCSTEVKIRKSSERARLSPRQRHLPEGVRGGMCHWGRPQEHSAAPPPLSQDICMLIYIDLHVKYFYS